MTQAHQAALNTLRQAGFFIVAWPPDEVESVENLDALSDYLITKGNEFIAEHQAEPEPGICPGCSGSGEGMHEGTRCGVCRGKGAS